MKSRGIKLLWIPFLLLAFQAVGSTPDQTDSTAATRGDTVTVHPGRLTGVIAGVGTLYFASLGGLYFAWYKDYPQSSFHLFNDGKEWMQMDKVGHTTSAYYISMIGYESFRWTGLNKNKSALYGSLLGFGYLLNIEILDGFSSQWGFSLTDFSSNTAGCLLFLGQQLAWNEQRFAMKYSFHQTEYAKYRPDLLGSNLIRNMVKDYNGQTYWLSGNIASFLPESSRFPKWINVAAGYSAEGMTGASSNPDSVNQAAIPHFNRNRQFFLSLDVDFTRIPTRSKTLKAIFTVFSFIKVPFPAIEYNTSGKFIFHPLCF